MKKLTKQIAERFAPGYGDPHNIEARSRVGLLEGWVSIVVNTLLGALKIWLGLVTGSLALMADAFHTLADSVTSAVVVLGFWLARQPADREHPFGHGRIDSVAGLAIAVLLAVVSFESGRAAVERIVNPQPVEAAFWVIAVVAASVLVKEWLSRFSLELGRLIGSDALVADAWHHRSDVFATSLVVVAFFGGRLGLPWLDGVMGLGVSIFIGWAAWAIIRQSVGPLLGEPAPDEVYREIGRIAAAGEGVRGVHDIIVHRYGLTHVISVHIEVPGDRSAIELHDTSERIEENIARRFPGHAVVHVDPIDFNHPHYAAVQARVAAAVESSPYCGTYHDLRIVGGEEHFTVILDITLNGRPTESQIEQCRQSITDSVRGSSFPQARVLINVEPLFSHPAQSV
ncbi:cation diffusion facilitator family transporter [bacterium]|nr:cation diffusion facilitator family transporter [bacterium]